MSCRLSSLALLVAVSSAFAGCMGVDTGAQEATASPTPSQTGDDDDDDGQSQPTPTPGPEPTPTPAGGSGADVEPNDDHDTATLLGSQTQISGACGDLDFSDIWKIQNVPAGSTVTLTVTWTESANDDLDLFVSNYDYSIDQGNEGVPPGDSPAQIAATFPAAQDAFVEVFCYYALNPDTAYTGTVTVQ